MHTHVIYLYIKDIDIMILMAISKIPKVFFLAGISNMMSGLMLQTLVFKKLTLKQRKYTRRLLQSEQKIALMTLVIVCKF